MPKKILGEDGLNIVVEQIKKRKTGKQRAKMHNVYDNSLGPQTNIPRYTHNGRKKYLTRKALHRYLTAQINQNTLDFSKTYVGPYKISTIHDNDWDFGMPVQRRFIKSPFTDIRLFDIGVADGIDHKKYVDSLFTVRNCTYRCNRPWSPYHMYPSASERYSPTNNKRFQHKFNVIVEYVRRQDFDDVWNYCWNWLNGAIVGINVTPNKQPNMLWYRVVGLSVVYDNAAVRMAGITAQCLPLFSNEPFTNLLK